uniref:Uncharacterized protein n=1 Tax=Candidatus Kentrum eta TaxID=2126337 RepID=A0A450VVR8_9GAMM|nr:MAG: hypothetical protein BECKH772A_GA0070896_103002 [Candidatus Kentron sp. H]VFK05295.1 MAG: hypothetical protein BECKH772B_GA0070898_105642 [Candidatus Kentron sp. H]VFK08908.1 MAG: hypothetical protein BECKH772C_GA0070978_105592 [Candidatus Kentron sp. H]
MKIRVAGFRPSSNFRNYSREALGVIVLYQLPNAFCPLFRSMIIRNVYSVPILEWGIRYGLAVPRYTSSYFLNALHACFVHANHRMRRIRNSVVNFEHRFHLAYGGSGWVLGVRHRLLF